MTGLILLVEDDRDIRESLIDALVDEGYRVVGALDGVDALEKLRASHEIPQLILLDLMMPRMNGTEFRRALSQVPLWSSIPVVVITADAQARAKAEAIGAHSFLRKPVKLRDLFAMVNRIFSETR